ncbi:MULTISPECIES: hypothetical protein [unclassified Brevundimonas]|uniref:hypothetical protein n=1 Tax=unclassified Brevundimonas TaxID=2622653 RepID=UPI003F93A0F8
MSTSERDAICKMTGQALPSVKHGSLRIWGQFFGRPYDNDHRVVGCDSLPDGVRFRFNEGETLTIWHPSRYSIDHNRFEILGASRVRWEWFYYGREKLPQNLFYIEYVASGDTADIQTNVDWFPIPTAVRRDGPAAELL